MHHRTAIILHQQIPIVFHDPTLELLDLKLIDLDAVLQILDHLQPVAVLQQKLDPLHRQLLRVLDGQRLESRQPILRDYLEEDVVTDAGAHADEDLADVEALTQQQLDVVGRTVADDLDDVQVQHRDEKLPRFALFLESGRSVDGSESAVRVSVVELDVDGLDELAVLKSERDEIRAAGCHDGNGSGVDLFHVNQAEVGQSRPDNL